jgi:hypothetical protein
LQIEKFEIETVLENTLQPIQPQPGLVVGDFDFPELHSGLCILKPSGSKNSLLKLIALNLITNKKSRFLMADG